MSRSRAANVGLVSAGVALLARRRSSWRCRRRRGGGLFGELRRVVAVARRLRRQRVDHEPGRSVDQLDADLVVRRRADGDAGVEHVADAERLGGDRQERELQRLRSRPTARCRSASTGLDASNPAPTSFAAERGGLHRWHDADHRRRPAAADDPPPHRPPTTPPTTPPPTTPPPRARSCRRRTAGRRRARWRNPKSGWVSLKDFTTRRLQRQAAGLRHHARHRDEAGAR